MRKVRVKAIRAMVVAAGLKPEQWRVRKFKRMYTRARQHRTHATNVGDSGGPKVRQPKARAMSKPGDNRRGLWAAVAAMFAASSPRPKL